MCINASEGGKEGEREGGRGAGRECLCVYVCRCVCVQERGVTYTRRQEEENETQKEQKPGIAGGYTGAGCEKTRVRVWGLGFRV